MLSDKTIEIVKSTVPLLAQAGTVVTDHFYKRLFSHNPELKNIFNMANQDTGRQQFALFNALAAYAQNIDNLAVLKEALTRINHKHTSLNILPEHYPIVGAHLIGTLKELLPEQFTPDVEYAWREAYGVLADICITEEAALYEHSKNKHGGWAGTRQFEITNKQAESELVTSFTLTPVDGEAVITHKPGQYLGIKVKPEGAEYEEIRQYSISQKSNAKNYRISVKKELQPKPGMVSNYLHSLEQGTIVELYPPAGDFFLRNNTSPVVLISAGVGQTPMLAMLETLLSDNSNQEIMYLHACENTQQHSFSKYLYDLTAQNNHLKTITWFNQATEGADFTGLMNLNAVQAQLPLSNGDFYLCGPAGFMAFIKKQLLELGVKNEQIHYEVFGPHEDL
ncbi:MULTISPECIES: NO-inducible flavohemoprotein [Pseudoalteromonas]|jgi:nitric oxide dioxygenase|uniref:NO-inducible flavohemoprotein n=1 Tax=Pseudoalteromonas TaxID=53246 RepID=UPI00040B8B8F|nr:MULTISPECIES: NO-inducible flavohemoprotein [Pseudoalteromonas]MBA6411131.1 NO-inducible flavohemoprotein [Pseudoalteromonas sp. 5Ae-yellow]MBB1306338.1 NO-inducible flavohemoprotein [Pseudoalteromonas sp. SR43-5]MBB1327598.1 NO-inducible flavohemoprotein [Pseudoalteromonas sp. SR45-1]MBB1347450.1 NO-inducible flavohemoprotein [Pseudoalteromonas sp. SG45-2]MBB1353177.1 NO-inducible flavohemoprotein [Pseudoalteromonas sp. SR45-5]|tara:strand:- start:16313 stop:17494 length:1182 start_codon:yes stop_codon:yes gene_type:complete